CVVSVAFISGCQAATQAAGNVTRYVSEATAEASESAQCPLNNTFQCASPLTRESQDRDAMSNREYQRYYKLDVAEAALWSFDLAPMPNTVRIQAAFHDENYSRISEERWEAGQPGIREVNFRAPGTYYLVLRAFPPHLCRNSSA